MLSRYSLTTLLFYFALFIFTNLLWFQRSKKQLLPLLISIPTVLIISEYYELPMFLAGLLGVAYWNPYPNMGFLLHHLNIILLFIWLIKIAQVKISLKYISILTLGLIVNTLLLVPEDSWSKLWTARLVGASCFLGATYESSMVDEKS